MRSASLTAAAAIEIDALPMSVLVRTSLATANVRWNNRFSTSPSVPAASAAHRLFHLAENLRLTEHLRVEPTGNAKRMRDGTIGIQRVRVWRKRGRRQIARAFEPARDRFRRTAMKVHLGAIARREDRRFLDHPARRELTQRARQRVRRERHALAYVERRSRVIESERVERHEWQCDGACLPSAVCR